MEDFKVNVINGEVSFEKLESGTKDRVKAQLQIPSTTTTGTSVRRINSKKISILGDSISTSTGGGAGIATEKTYGGLLIANQNCQIFRKAISGGTVQTELNSFTRWGHLDDNYTPDVIFVFGGVNDFLNDVLLGQKEDLTTATFYGSLNVLCKNLVAKYTTSKIIWITPLHNNYSFSNNGSPELNSSTYLYKYVDAIIEICGFYGISIIDGFKNSGLTFQNAGLLTLDGIHPNEQGHKMLYNLIINECDRLLTSDEAAGTPTTGGGGTQPNTGTFDNQSSAIADFSYNDATNQLSFKNGFNANNFQFAMSTNILSAKVKYTAGGEMPVNAILLGSDIDQNAIILYCSGGGNIMRFPKSGTGNPTQITQLPFTGIGRPNFPVGSEISILHGDSQSDHFQIIGPGNSIYNILYADVPDLVTKGTGMVCAGAPLNVFQFENL